MRVLHRGRQFTGGAGGVLEYRHIVGTCRASEGGRKARHLIEQRGIGHDDADPVDLPGDLELLRIGDQQLRLAVIDPQPQSVEPEEREQRHADRPHDHRAEQAQVERQRRLEHEGDAVARLNAVRHQPVREARGAGGDLIEAQDLVGSVRMRNAHRDATRSIRVTADALVGDIEVLAITVEEFPQRP